MPTQDEWLNYAHQILAAYQLENAEIRWLAQTHNAVFEVQQADKRYVLRLNEHDVRRWDAIYGELMWLRWLRLNTTLLVPVPVTPSTQFTPNYQETIFNVGQTIVTLHNGYIVGLPPIAAFAAQEMHIHGVLFEYQTGDTFALPPEWSNGLGLKMFDLGRNLAALHQTQPTQMNDLFIITFVPALNMAGLVGEKKSNNHPPLEDFLTPKQLELLQSLQRYGGESLVGRGVRYDITPVQQQFTSDQLDLLDILQQHFNVLMLQIGTAPADWGMIHGDFLLKNVLWDGDTVRFLDFEYCGMGYYLYDVAKLLWELKLQPRYAALKEALLDGYTRVRSLGHTEHLEALIALRHMLSMHWIALNHDHSYVAGRAAAILAQRAQELRDYLATGELKRM